MSILCEMKNLLSRTSFLRRAGKGGADVPLSQEGRDLADVGVWSFAARETRAGAQTPTA